MEVQIEKIEKTDREMVLIRCHTLSEEVKDIEAFVLSRQGKLSGLKEGQLYQVPLSEIFYAETVDGRTFLYTRKEVYETSLRLYELEEKLKKHHFLRISRSALVNLMKIRSIRPALNGRFRALLESGEELIISRSYVKGLKEALKGE